MRLVAVDEGVRLEVLDWGGTGKPMVLLAGGGNTAHIFDDFAPTLTGHFHVYGVTRRGFGASSYADPASPATRLGDDVLAVMDALNLKRPILVGHSIAGAEMSSIANRHPERVAALVYLDAAYPYAFDNGDGASMDEIQKLQAPQHPPPSGADLSTFSALADYFMRMDGFRFPEGELWQQRESTPGGAAGDYRNPPGGAMLGKLLKEKAKFNRIPVPALVIFANPHGLGRWVDTSMDPAVRKAAAAYSSALSALVEKQQKSVEHGAPQARVITIPGANHYVFLSNEAEVLRAMSTFLAGLQP